MEFHFDCEAEQIAIKQYGRIIVDNLWDSNFGCKEMNFYIHNFNANTKFTIIEGHKDREIEALESKTTRL